MTAAECRQSFREAVIAGRNGHYGLAQQLVHRVRVKFGEKAAEDQKRELWAYIKSGKPA
ncbi:hypothetical protein [Burkholderia alba]|uniref:hypothetical protein n=1 Tax=Burkholderia alba TaxID=2683677 RepID=UPI002B05FD2F|nr:hypothetical protein [Burkholderia alba]